MSGPRYAWSSEYEGCDDYTSSKLLPTIQIGGTYTAQAVNDWTQEILDSVTFQVTGEGLVVVSRNRTIGFARNGAVARIGSFSTAWYGYRGPTLRRAVRVWGSPTRVWRTRYDTCFSTWRRHGLYRAHWASFGLAARCSQKLIGYVTIKGERWATGAGLGIGSSVNLLRILYPRASRSGEWWTLRRTWLPYGNGFWQPTLQARVRYGRVRTFFGWVGAHGD